MNRRDFIKTTTMLPAAVKADLIGHLERVQWQHEGDLRLDQCAGASGRDRGPRGQEARDGLHGEECV